MRGNIELFTIFQTFSWAGGDGIARQSALHVLKLICKNCALATVLRQVPSMHCCEIMYS